MVCSVCDTRGLTLTGQKTTIALEELKEVGVDIEFEHRAISLGDNEQKEPEFLKHNPNGRIPALEDKARGVSVFESAAMCVQISCPAHLTACSTSTSTTTRSTTSALRPSRTNTMSSSNGSSSRWARWGRCVRLRLNAESFADRPEGQASADSLCG